MFFQLLIGAIVVSSIYGLIGLGYSLIYQTSGLMSFTQGEILMLGGFLGLTFYKEWGLPFPITFFLVLIIMFLLGMGLERFIIRPVQKKGGRAIHIVLVTIGVSIVLQNLAMLIYSTTVQMFPAIFKWKGIKIAGFNVAAEQIMTIVLAIVAMLLLHIFMNKSKLGTSMRAAAQDGLAASAYGINVSFSKGLSWAIACALSAVAGMLLGPVYGVYTNMGTMVGLKGFCAAVVGGYGNMYGAIIGGILLGFIETFAASYISSNIKDFVAFAVLIIVLIIKPTGIFNAKIIEE